MSKQPKTFKTWDGLVHGREGDGSRTFCDLVTSPDDQPMSIGSHADVATCPTCVEGLKKKEVQDD